MLRTIGAVLLACLAAAGSALSAEGSASAPIVFRDVNVLTMTSEAILEHRDVFVVDGKIDRITSTGAAIPKGARVIPGRGRYLLPGLMDMHVHMDDDRAAGLYLAYGVTRVRNMSAHGSQYLRRKRIADGMLTGPVMYTSGPALSSRSPQYTFNVSSPEEARKHVRLAKAAGADWIKTMRMDREIFEAILDEAQKQGLPVGGHLPSLTLPILEIYRSGLRSHEHVAEVFTSASFFNIVPDEGKLPEVAKQIHATGITISTILHREAAWWQMRQEKDAYLSDSRVAELESFVGATGLKEAREFIDGLKNEAPEVRERTTRIQSNLPFILKIVKALHDAGVPLVIGTDSHFYFSYAGVSLHQEMEMLRQAGLTPYQALRVATVNAARLLDASAQLGTIQEGKVADLVLAEANPLGSLETLRNPIGVMVAGRWYDRIALHKLVQDGEHRAEEEK